MGGWGGDGSVRGVGGLLGECGALERWWVSEHTLGRCGGEWGVNEHTRARAELSDDIKTIRIFVLELSNIPLRPESIQTRGQVTNVKQIRQLESVYFL